MASMDPASNPSSDSSGPEQVSQSLSSISVDPAEMASFARMAEDWWNPEGMFKPLHNMNGARLELIIKTVCSHFGRDADTTTDTETDISQPLSGLRLLDIGCGGGLLCEPMRRLGAQVTGVDALEKNLKTAQTHAAQSGLDIDYRHGTIEQMVAAQEQRFDIVLNMEVIEHVVNPKDFMRDCAHMIKPDGIMLCSTINRSFKAFAFAIVGAEYILRWLPRGTHQYEKFIKPNELSRYMQSAGLQITEQIGMSLNPVNNVWRYSGDKSINYITIGVKP